MAFDEQTADELVEALETAGLAPELDLLRACLAREEALRPYLLEMLATDPYEAYGLPLDSEDPRAVVNIHAGHLLLAFKEPAALPLFTEIYRDEERENLIEWFNPWLHEYGAAAVAPFAAVMADENVYRYGRAAATEILSAIGRRFPETRETIVTTLRDALPTLPERALPDRDTPPDGVEPDEIWAWIASTLAELDAQEALPQIKALYDANPDNEEIQEDEERGE